MASLKSVPQEDVDVRPTCTSAGPHSLHVAGHDSASPMCLLLLHLRSRRSALNFPRPRRIQRPTAPSTAASQQLQHIAHVNVAFAAVCDFGSGKFAQHAARSVEERAACDDSHPGDGMPGRCARVCAHLIERQLSMLERVPVVAIVVLQARRSVIGCVPSALHTLCC